MTLKGVNADWAKAHQCAHVQMRSLQRAQTGFTADTGISLPPSRFPTTQHLHLCPPFSHFLQIPTSLLFWNWFLSSSLLSLYGHIVSHVGKGGCTGSLQQRSLYYFTIFMTQKKWKFYNRASSSSVVF